MMYDAVQIVYKIKILKCTALFVIMADGTDSDYPKTDFLFLNCYRAIYWVPIDTDFMFVKHREAKAKKTVYVRCRNYVSFEYFVSLY